MPTFPIVAYKKIYLLNLTYLDNTRNLPSLLQILLIQEFTMASNAKITKIKRAMRDAKILKKRHKKMKKKAEKLVVVS